MNEKTSRSGPQFLKIVRIHESCVDLNDIIYILYTDEPNVITKVGD